ncbi:MAG: type I polyketide synthase, partial [Gammaproteobacteria bacterium]
RLQTQGRRELEENYSFYPGLLDACFQVIDCCRGNVDAALFSEDIFIPASIGHVNLYRPLAPDERLYCFARLHTDAGRLQEGGKITGDLWLVNEDDELIAKIEGFVSRRSSKRALQQALKSMRAEAAESSFAYRLVWQKFEAPASSTEATEVLGPFALFADDPAAAENVQERLRAAGIDSVIVADETMSAATKHAVAVDPEDPAAMQRLFETLDQRFEKPWHLLYLCDAQDGDELPALAEKGAWLELLQLLQAVAGYRNAGGTGIGALHVVTRGAWRLDGNDPINPMQRLIWGMLRGVQAEWSDFRTNLIEADTDTETLVPALAAIAQAQRDTGETGSLEDQWLIQQDTLWVPRLTRTSAPAPAATAIDPEKSYLITGGLGGVGLRLAQWLVQQGGRHIVLLGRSEPGADARSVIDALEHDARVLCLTSDVCDAPEMANAFARIAAECPPLGGIFHAVGVLDDGAVEHMSASRFLAVAAPKVFGAWHLDRQSEHLPLDFFVAFSSITSVLGSKGQINYCAANAFLDGLMARRRAQGKPGLSVNWGPWDEVGMITRLDERFRRAMADNGLRPMAPARCFEALAPQLANGEQAALMVADIEWPRFLGQYAGPMPALFETLREGAVASAAPQELRGGYYRKLEALPAAERGKALNEYLRSTLARVLGFDDARSIKERDRFFDMGLDSLLAVDMKTRLEKDLDIALSTTLVFDYPTLEALSAHLRATLADAVDAAAASALAPSSRPKVQEAAAPAGEEAADLENLSAEALDALLGDKFDRIGSYLDQ